MATDNSVLNLKPPDMITDPSQFSLYEKKMRRWSRLSNLSHQLQFDLILTQIPTSNPLNEKLEEEIGESTEAATKGVDVILDKLKEWFGKEEDIDAFINYKDFEEKSRGHNQDLLQFVNEWESLYNRCKAKDDTISDRVLAFKLIVACNLSEMDHKLVFREARSKEKDGKVFERTKVAIRMFYNAGHLKTLNIGKKTLITSDELNDDILKTLLDKGWKAPKPRMSSGFDYKKWIKCKHCKCDCIPADKRCECPCSKHWSKNCPKKPNDSESSPTGQVSTLINTISDDQESNYGNKTLIIGTDEERSKELTRFLYSSSDTTNFAPMLNDGKVGVSKVFKVNYELNGKDAITLNHNQGSNVIIDTGAPITVGGTIWLKKTFLSMPKAMRSQLILRPSENPNFEFGGGEKRRSLGKVLIPGIILDEDLQAHKIQIDVEIIDAKIPLLLGGNSLDKAEATITAGPNPYLTLPTILTPGTRIPLQKKHHYTFTLFPPTPEDDKVAAQRFLKSDKWTPDTAKVAIAYIVKAKDPNYEAVNNPKVLLSKSFQRKEKLRNPGHLTKENIIKLHHYFGHCTAERLEKLIKNAGKWRPEHADFMLLIKNCQVCAVESKRNSLPKTAIPRASNFNQLVTMDIKYNTKFSNKATPYILNIIDAFTRYRSAVFIPNKSATTVVEAFLTNWIRIFGRPSGVHFDRGTEFVNSEMQALCEKYSIKVTMTATHSPNQNGLNEKSHHYVDFMMAKIMNADPTCSPHTALTWAIHASNVLENRFGFSPSMLVFGRNISAHPDLNPNEPTSLETNVDVSQKIKSHLSAISKAREAFIQAESDKTIAEALKARLVHRHEDLEIGQWIYWKNPVVKECQGPHKIVFMDNKNVFIIRLTKLIPVNRDHVMLRRVESVNIMTQAPCKQRRKSWNSLITMMSMKLLTNQLTPRSLGQIGCSPTKRSQARKNL